MRKRIRDGLPGRRPDARSGDAVLACLGHSSAEVMDEIAYLSQSHAGNCRDRAALQFRPRDVLRAGNVSAGDAALFPSAQAFVPAGQERKGRLARRILRRLYPHRSARDGAVQLPDAIPEASRHRHHQGPDRVRYHLAHDPGRDPDQCRDHGDQSVRVIRARRGRQSWRGHDHARELRRNGGGPQCLRQGEVEAARRACRRAGQTRSSGCCPG